MADPLPKPGVVAEAELATEKPTVKPHCTIDPAALMDKAFLETGDDVRAFLEILHQQLEEAVAAGKRVRIG